MEKVRELITAEFDFERRILHLSAKKTIRVADKETLCDLCGTVQEILQQYGPDRMYMIVDLSRFAIEPALSGLYMQKIGAIVEQYLHPGGLARYGYQITRVTIKLAAQGQSRPADGIFATHDEALSYIQGLIDKNHQSTEEYSGNEGDPKDRSGGVLLDNITFGHKE